MAPETIVTFWRDAGPDKWFVKNAAFDAAIATHFRDAHFEAAAGGFAGWRETATGALALVLLLDQFPRNMFRNSPHAFASDGLALNAARAAIARGFDRAVDEALQAFFYVPFMHAEDLAAQEECIALCDRPGLENNHKFAIIHRDIIARFGRFPHRNIVLGRMTTPEEQAFLDAGGFAG